MQGRGLWLVGCAALAGLVSVEARSETTKQFGQWVVGLTTEAEAMYAGTVNDSGEILAENCTFEDGKCTWSLGMPTKCKLGDSYPMLVNSSSGAAHLTAHCDRKTEGDLYVYLFAWKELEAAIKGAKWVGLAFPSTGTPSRSCASHSMVSMSPRSSSRRDVFRGAKGPEERRGVRKCCEAASSTLK